MAIEKHSIPDSDSAIWAETDNLNYFVKTAITPDTSTGIENKTSGVAAGSRRQYPGDPTPVGFKATDRVYMVDPGRKSGNAIPGKPFRIDDGTENRMMRYTGTWTDVHAYFTGDAANDCRLYSPSGTRYVITASGGVTVTKAKTAPKPAAV